MDATETKPAVPISTCRQCRRAIFADPTPIAATEDNAVLSAIQGLKPTVCTACHELNEAKDQQAIANARFEAWERLCPPLYRTTNPEHHAMPPKEKQDRVIQWKCGTKGLIVHGPTRKCKTRCVWLLIKRLMVEDGKSVKAMTSGEFARQCAHAHCSGTEAVRDWFESMITCDVLFLDDLGKFKLTERIESDLFDIIEHRVAHLRPCIFTTNMVGDTLSAAMSADRSQPLVARIREFCESISIL